MCTAFTDHAHTVNCYYSSPLIILKYTPNINLYQNIYTSRADNYITDIE